MEKSYERKPLALRRHRDAQVRGAANCVIRVSEECEVMESAARELEM